MRTVVYVRSKYFYITVTTNDRRALNIIINIFWSPFSQFYAYQVWLRRHRRRRTNARSLAVDGKMNASTMKRCSAADASSMLVNFVHGRTENRIKVKKNINKSRILRGTAREWARADQCKIKTDEHDFDSVRRTFLFAWKNIEDWTSSIYTRMYCIYTIFRGYIHALNLYLCAPTVSDCVEPIRNILTRQNEINKATVKCVQTANYEIKSNFSPSHFFFFRMCLFRCDVLPCVICIWAVHLL